VVIARGHPEFAAEARERILRAGAAG